MSICSQSNCSKMKQKAKGIQRCGNLYHFARGPKLSVYKKDHEPPLFLVAHDLCSWDRVSFTAGGILKAVISQIIPQKLQLRSSEWTSRWDFSSLFLSPSLQTEFCIRFCLNEKYFVVWNFTNSF